MVKVFDQKGTFQAYYAATAWLNENNISYGSLCRDEPVGLKRGECHIPKWKNIMASERKFLDGKMTSGNFREGPITIEIAD